LNTRWLDSGLYFGVDGATRSVFVHFHRFQSRVADFVRLISPRTTLFLEIAGMEPILSTSGNSAALGWISRYPIAHRNPGQTSAFVAILGRSVAELPLLTPENILSDSSPYFYQTL